MGVKERLVLLDVWVLQRVRLGVEWCVEWVGVSQRWIERGLIAGFVASRVLMQMLDRTSGSAPRWLDAVVTVLLLLFLGWLHRVEGRDRALRLWAGDGFFMRIWMLLVVPLLRLPLVWLPGSEQQYCIDGSNVCFTLALYVMAYPHGGEPGKRRRAKVAAWKESFGRQWMPEGVKA